MIIRWGFNIIFLGGAVLTKSVLFENLCDHNLFVAAVPSSINRSEVQPLGGWEMRAGSSRTIEFPDNWEGRVWPRTGCRGDGRDNNTIFCETGDCDNKVECKSFYPNTGSTAIELKFGEGIPVTDTYFITLSDGYNVGASIQPYDSCKHPRGNGPEKYICGISKCNVDFREIPTELLKRGGITMSTSGLPDMKKTALPNDTIFSVFALNLCGACIDPNQVAKFPDALLELCKSKDSICCSSKVPCNAAVWPRKIEFPNLSYPDFFKRQCADIKTWPFDTNFIPNTCYASGYKITWCPEKIDGKPKPKIKGVGPASDPPSNPPGTNPSPLEPPPITTKNKTLLGDRSSTMNTTTECTTCPQVVTSCYYETEEECECEYEEEGCALEDIHKM